MMLPINTESFQAWINKRVICKQIQAIAMILFTELNPTQL